jgi:hydrogenase-4 component F
MAASPWLAALLVAGLAIAFGGVMTRLHGMAFGETPQTHVLSAYRLAPMALHVALVTVAGVYLPETIVAWFRQVAGLLG